VEGTRLHTFATADTALVVHAPNVERWLLVDGIDRTGLDAGRVFALLADGDLVVAAEDVDIHLDARARHAGDLLIE